jgi:hypothetical protein
MSWIKRNLVFVIGSLVAFVLMALAVLFLLQKLGSNNKAFEEWSKQIAELKRLYALNPHPGELNPRPGDTNAVDNIRLGRKQQEQLRDELRKSRTHFVPIPRIPDPAGLTPLQFSEEFPRRLRATISQLESQARNASVTLPNTNYSFTFASVKERITFSQHGLRALSTQLGEVKAIADILFPANINALDGFRREQICAEDDPQKAADDYFDLHSVTNELAVLSPYEVTFRCFSTELAAVLAGFAKSPHGFIVKTINIEPAPPAAETQTPIYNAPIYNPAPAAAAVQPTTPAQSVEEMYRRRYGISMGRGRAPVPTPAAPAPAAVAAAPPVKTGPQTVINEKPVKVTVLVVVVKPLGGQQAEPAPKPAPPPRRPPRP